MGAAAQPICPQYIPRVTYRAAQPYDARALVRLASIASGGIDDCAWKAAAKAGESPLDVGRRQLGATGGCSSYENCRVAEIDGSPIGMLIAYPGREVSTSSEPALGPVDAQSYFIEDVAVFSQWRSHGIGTSFISLAEQSAMLCDLRQTMLRVFADNCGAVRLFERLGYEAAAEVELAPNPLFHFTGALLFMTKQVR